MLLLSASALSAQEASYRFYGSPCQDALWSLPVDFRVRGLPRLGQRVTIFSVGRYTNRVVSQKGYLTLGFSRTRLGPFALPLDLRAIPTQPRHCGSLYHSLDVIAHVGSTYSYVVPIDRRLLGARFYQQVLELRCNSQQRSCYWAASRGLEVVIGR